MRLGLVANLLQHEHAFPDGERLQRVWKAREVAVGFDLATPFDEHRREGFREAHRQLSSVLRDFWDAVSGVPQSATRTVVRDLQPELERVTAEMDQRLARMDRDLMIYQGSIHRFPGNLVARLASLQGSEGPANPDALGPQESASLAGAGR